MTRRYRSYVFVLVAVLAMVGAGCSASVPTATQTPAPASTPTALPAPTETEAADPAPTETPERSSESQSVAEQPTEVPAQPAQQPVEQAGAAPESIRDIDFLNGFTYDTLLEFGPGPATVVDGSFENGEFGDNDFYWFGVSDVSFGDFDDDGVEEAVMVTTWNGGGTGYFDSVRAYRLVRGSAQLAGVVGFGDRADGGVYDVSIVDGTVRVQAFAGGEGACCPNQIAETTLVLGQHTLTAAASSPARTWIRFSDGPDELKFLPDTSSAVLTLYPFETSGRVVFEAAAGQRLELLQTSGPRPAALTLIDPTTGALVDSPGDTILPSDAVYELAVSFDEGDVDRDDATTIELHIDRGESTPTSWTIGVDQVLLDDEPFVHTSVTWPIFESRQPGTTAANQALGDYATGLDDWWVADVTEFEDPQDDSSYDVNFQVTLATADLVSVHFDYFDYVCCRPYPNYGQRAAVLDLQAGTLIPVEEILDFSRIGEINALWLEELARQDLLPADLIVSGVDVARFDSATLTPTGVEFGTDRNSLGGGTPGTRTLVTYQALGDLIDPNLAQRAQQ